MPGVTPAVTPFITGADGPALPAVAEGRRPPLSLQVELVYPDGTTTRWDKDAREAKDRATGITFRTQRYTGFADAQLTLNRRIDLEYPDLGLLDGLNLIGHDGSVAYEGRIASLPRNLQSAPQITVQAQGWMSHAKDEPFVENFVNRDLGLWVAPSRPRTQALLVLKYSPGSIASHPDEEGNPVLELSFGGPWETPYKPVAEAWWLPQPGVSVGALYYDLISTTTVGGEAGWHIHAFLSEDDKRTGFDLTANLNPAPKAAYQEALGARTAAGIQLYNEETTGGAAGATYAARFAKLAIYGTHGLTRRGEDPGGFYVSDMMKNIASRFAPKLDPSGIEETTLPIPHATFLTDTFAYDAFQTLNAYHRWEMAVYEKRKLSYWPVDRNDYDWEVRLSDPGTTVSLQGDDTANLCNGVIVNYRDLSTGYQTRLSPDAVPELRDESPDNPVNLNGLKVYTPMTLSVPTTRGVAIEAGRIYLAEFNQSAAPGSITVTGHVRDRAGHFQQGWKVRASDRLIISDIPNDRVRIIGETSWDHDTKQLTIAVDSSVKRLDAILARISNAVEASNLNLP